MSHKFPKSARLLNAHDYSQVFENRSIRAGSTAGTVLALPASDNRSRLGIIVAKKNVRLATIATGLNGWSGNTFETTPSLDERCFHGKTRAVH